MDPIKRFCENLPKIIVYNFHGFQERHLLQVQACSTLYKLGGGVLASIYWMELMCCHCKVPAICWDEFRRRQCCLASRDRAQGTEDTEHQTRSTHSSPKFIKFHLSFSRKRPATQQLVLAPDPAPTLQDRQCIGGFDLGWVSVAANHFIVNAPLHRLGPGPTGLGQSPEKQFRYARLTDNLRRFNVVAAGTINAILML